MTSIIMKSFICKATILVVLVIMVQMKGNEAQDGSCAAQVGGLTVCAPYAVPGAENASPSQECCAALGGINHDCICNTFRVARQLPSSCNLAPLNCGN
ncbi:hypothetical protein RND81_05G083500 [Saponaria officinalis]|uniref:Bifunctional inhibitor/plant lipid transfer protein/seed storage helical domain-containing protein n=1 Tax=Saponaria officinalis TaxID=3572 RepID=A0AAW1KYQ6_SAPOF